MRNRLNEGAIIWGGEIEETDPYATRKRLMDEYFKANFPQEVKPKKEDDKENLKKLVDDIKKRYER